LVLAAADALADVVRLLDPRGRRVARQNLRAVFGSDLPRRERRAILVASYRNAVRALALLAHLRPLTLARYRRFVDVDEEQERRFTGLGREGPPPVVVSGHVGNWEMVLAAGSLYLGGRRIAYLAETSGSTVLDELLSRLRDRGSGEGAMRKGGALAMRRALAEDRAVGLLVDRNVRRRHGGRWVPFLGVPARTTPLPATLARRFGAPLHVCLCLPLGRRRWRLWMSPDLRGPDTGDEEGDVLADTARVNDVLSRVIRERPEAWTWMIKRWKDRPTPDLGPYPPYSRFDGGRDFAG
jgi:KDO2-lipid IV(A) lauroyltransferase